MSGATYETLRSQWAFLRDSYWGGERYRYPTPTTLSSARVVTRIVDETGAVTSREQRYDSYLVPHPAESNDNFDARVALATYLNVVQPVVDAYAEAVTSGVSRDLGSLGAYLEDVDHRGSTWGEHVEDVARWAAVYGIVAAVADAPKAHAMRSRLDEQAAGARPYVITVPPTAWAWIDVDDSGAVTAFAWVEEAYVDGTRDCQRVRVRELCREGWRIYEGSISTAPGQTLSAQRDKLAADPARATPLPAALEGELPVEFVAYKRDTSTPYPMGLSLVGDAAAVARAIYNYLSWAQEIHRHAGFPFLALPLASTGGQMDPQTRISVGPTRALPYDAQTGAPSYVQPSSESTRELREHCLFLFQAALRTAGLEMAADASAQVQSGEALRIRSRDFESRAKRFARNMQRYEARMLRLLARLAGTTDAPTVTYAERFTLPDPTADLANATKLLTDMPVEIGATAKLAAVRTAVRAALALSDGELSKVMAEVGAIFARDAAAFEARRAKELAADTPLEPTAPETQEPQ